jgi:hypothetical protein
VSLETEALRGAVAVVTDLFCKQWRVILKKMYMSEKLNTRQDRSNYYALQIAES